MTAVAAPAVRWMTSSALWPGFTGGELRRPALLRFSSDAFMDELEAELRTDPARLAERVAHPVAFRERPAGAPAGWTPPAERLTLYLPAHGHFNLVVASLVCRRPGLPDHQVHAEKGERAAFVLRRVERAADGTERELGWVPPASAAGPTGWVAIPAGAETVLLQGEQTYPLFPVSYRDGELTRRLLAGLIPTMSGEVAPAAVTPPPPTPGARPDQDPRWEELDRTVVIPIRSLKDPSPPVRFTDAELADPSAFVVLDLADFLARQVPSFWAALLAHARPAAGPEQRLYDALGASVDTASALTWHAALERAWAEAAAITGEAPGPVSLRINVTRSALAAQTATAPPAGDPPGTASLQGLVRAVLPVMSAAPGPVPATVRLPKFEPTGRARYRIRCVYQRPHCAPWHGDVVGEPSADFAIATFFDPDAPARDIRIALPLQTGLKDLRKYRRNVGMMISDQLRGQLGRVTDLKKAMDGNIADEERWELGMICQLSIPIITICALIVLFVFLVLLNIVFFWLPFFRICLPIPIKANR